MPAVLKRLFFRQLVSPERSARRTILVRLNLPKIRWTYLGFSGGSPLLVGFFQDYSTGMWSAVCQDFDWKLGDRYWFRVGVWGNGVAFIVDGHLVLPEVFWVWL